LDALAPLALVRWSPSEKKPEARSPRPRRRPFDRLL